MPLFSSSLPSAHPSQETSVLHQRPLPSFPLSTNTLSCAYTLFWSSIPLPPLLPPLDSSCFRCRSTAFGRVSAMSQLGKVHYKPLSYICKHISRCGCVGIWHLVYKEITHDTLTDSLHRKRELLAFILRRITLPLRILHRDKGENVQFLGVLFVHRQGTALNYYWTCIGVHESPSHVYERLDMSVFRPESVYEYDL